MISVLNLSRHVSWPNVEVAILGNVPCALERTVYSAVLDGTFCVYLLSRCVLMYSLRPLISSGFSVGKIYPLM